VSGEAGMVKFDKKQQVVQIKGGAKLLALLDDLGSMEAVVKKATQYISTWRPAEDSKVARAKARNVKDYMRIIAQVWRDSQAIEIKEGKVSGGVQAELTGDLPPEAVMAIADIIKEYQLDAPDDGAKTIDVTAS